MKPEKSIKLQVLYIAFQFLYISLAINIIDGRGLSNKARHDLLQKKRKIMLC